MEISHFLGSCVGIALLVLSRALMNRTNAAWLLTLALLIAGVTFSLAKGLDYEEAAILTIFAGFLYASRDEFHRKAAVFTEPLSGTWIASILMVLVGTVWLGLFAHKYVEYDNDLWWSFSWRGDAPRFLRGTAGALVTGIGLGLYMLLKPKAGPGPLPTATEGEVKDLVVHSPSTLANLAFLGDKLIFADEAHDAFIMYAVRGGTWVAMGDPIGNSDKFEDLVYDFKEAADRYGGQVVFYEIKTENLPLYIDLGLIFVKIGEAARLSLPDFTLEGGGRKTLRQTYNRFKKQAQTAFEIVEREAFPSILPELKEVSDAWLAEKNAKEKGFSLGYFDPDYLSKFRTAVLRREGRIVAFANLWESGNKEELSFDLMRHVPGVAGGAMDQLIVDIAYWGKERGYRWLDLGMAPFSGLEVGRQFSRWNKAARLLYEHGEMFYNFKGLRGYKEKFDPVWEPRYLAYPSKISLPLVLTDLAFLISGGAKISISRSEESLPIADRFPEPPPV